jgi:hypothetical protein
MRQRIRPPQSVIGRPFQRTVQIFNRIVGSLLILELQLDILLRIVGMPYPNHGTVGTDQSLHRHCRPQSSSGFRFTAGASGFSNLSRSSTRVQRNLRQLGCCRRLAVKHGNLETFGELTGWTWYRVPRGLGTGPSPAVGHSAGFCCRDDDEIREQARQLGLVGHFGRPLKVVR